MKNSEGYSHSFVYSLLVGDVGSVSVVVFDGAVVATVTKHVTAL